MEKRTLGKNGPAVSRLGFGGAVAGLKNYLKGYDPFRNEDRREMVESIHAALAGGITYFDTAPGYGGGESERIFGEAFQGINPGAYVLATKTHWRGVKPGDLHRSLEASLERLKRPYVDVLQLHGDTYPPGEAEALLANADGVAKELLQIKQQGLARQIGFTSEDNNEAVYRFIRSGVFDVMQICYNFLFQHPYEPNRPFGSILEACKQGMGIITMRATTSGWFQKFVQAANPNNTFNYTGALINFVLSNRYVDVVLVGMRNREEVEKNIALCLDEGSRMDIEKMWRYYV